MFWGCGIVLCLVLLCVLGAWMMLTSFRRKVLDATAAAPVELSIPEITPADIEEAQEKVNVLGDAKATAETTTVEFDGDDLRALICDKPEFGPYREHVKVDIVDDLIVVDCSLPLTKFLPHLRTQFEQYGIDIDKLVNLEGRYFNGTFKLAVSAKDGYLKIVPAEILAKGEPVDEMFMEQLRDVNFAADAQNDPETREALVWIKKLYIRDGKLIMETRGQAQ